MEMNAENMYLFALVETLKKENDILKEENVITLQKLEAAENSVSRLKAQILVMNEAKNDTPRDMEKINLKHQFEISKIRKYRNKTGIHRPEFEYGIISSTGGLSSNVPDA